MTHPEQPGENAIKADYPFAEVTTTSEITPVVSNAATQNESE